MEFDNNNRGAIWKNADRKSEKHPHWRGSAMIDGVEYWISAWKGKDSKDTSPVVTFAFQPKEQKPSGEKFLDDIPF